ncbi:DNA repair protein rad52 [Teratosphaeriaceae sp. CCFEE 6253]|nr:DNA repair protein rad52 [Teratosphaeriaceae sp. CCFEE 6253]
MPRPGDQHRDTAASANPFADNPPSISAYTAVELATLQSRLEKQLGPEYISTRPGAGGGKVHYLAAEKVINLANEVFGFHGWSSSLQNIQIDFCDENASNGKISLGLSAIVRVTLREGNFHEDIGYGHIENCKGKAAAFEKAKKEAATDALKRALRTFGNVLGNCLYDKDYLTKVTKVKVAPSKWDSGNLHRHPDYAPIQQQSIGDSEAVPHEQKLAAGRRLSSVQSGMSFGSAEFEDDFGGSALDDVDFGQPDEAGVDDSTITVSGVAFARPAHNGQQQQQRQSVPRMQSMPHLRPPAAQMIPMQNAQVPQQPSTVQRPANAGAHAPPTHGMNQPVPTRNGMGPPQQPGLLMQQVQQPVNGAQQQSHAPQQQQPSGMLRQQAPHAPHPQLQHQPAGHTQQQPHAQQQVPARPNVPQPPPNGSGPRSNPSSGTTVADSPSNHAAERQQYQHRPQPQSHHQPQRHSPQKQLPPNGHGPIYSNDHTTNSVRVTPLDHLPLPRDPPPGIPDGFVTGRSAPLLQEPSDPNLVPSAAASAAAKPFNPLAESPSIRRTFGVNPGKSAPVMRGALGSAAASGGAGPGMGNGMAKGSGSGGTGETMPPRTTNFVNPAADSNRRIGAPPAAGGFGGGRGSGAYRPPTAVGVKRPPLSDVSNVHQNQMDGATDGAKKARVEGPGVTAAGEVGEGAAIAGS